MVNTKITFVLTRHVYDSYIDFRSLVSLSGFPTIYVDELDISEHGVFIVSPMNGEWRPHINNQHKAGKPVNAHLVLWNLERPEGSAGSIGQYANQCRYLQYGLWENGSRFKEENGEQLEAYGRFVDEVWVSDAKLADEIMQRFVVLGSDYGLGEPGTDKQYGLVHMSMENPRRVNIYKHLKNIGHNCWPPERDEVLKKSRFALNVHKDHHPFQEPLRFALFAAYGLPILSEHIFNVWPWANDETMIITTYDGLVGKLNQMLDNDYGRWREMGERARRMMCEEFQFGKMVRKAVKETVGNWR